MNYTELLECAIKASIVAGKEILRIYNTAFFVETKSDNTPVTEADKTSSKIIAASLAHFNIPLISEEDEVIEHCIRKAWDKVWIVDPLDGTKEFVKRNGEFAINIALIEKNTPSIGVIYAPVLDALYFACKSFGSYKIENVSVFCNENPTLKLNALMDHALKLPVQNPPMNYTIVVSRSHLSREINDYIKKREYIYGKVNTISVGSSVKQCWVAEGLAHEYPRLGRTMEWDTAAGQCILEESQAQLLDLETNKPMIYNKLSLENNFFVATRAAFHH